MDFRLKVFHSVATNLSFTKASKELFISQPAISKHIHELEVQYKTPLFDRVGSHIGLTHAGELLLSHTKQLLAAYRQMDFEMNLLTDNFAGELRLGARYDDFPICAAACPRLFYQEVPGDKSLFAEREQPRYRTGLAGGKDHPRPDRRNGAPEHTSLYPFYERRTGRRGAYGQFIGGL